MRTWHAKTMTDLHEQLCHDIAHATAKQLDVISTVDVQIHNTISEADSMEWDFNLKRMWLTRSRWTMMVRQYLDPEEVLKWLNDCTRDIGVKNRGIAVLRTRIVKPRGGEEYGNKVTRRWGSCMLAVSYKAIPQPQVTLYSRTSYLGYLSAMDLSVAWMLGRYVAHGLGVPVESLKFVWINEQLQYHNFKSLAFFLNHPDKKKRKFYRAILLTPTDKLKTKHRDWLETTPAMKLSRKWMENILRMDAEGKTLGDMSYNTYRRIRRRYHTEVLGYKEAKKFEGWSYYTKGPKKGEKKEYFKAYQPLDSVDIHELDLTPIGLRLGSLTLEPFAGETGDKEEDDDE